MAAATTEPTGGTEGIDPRSGPSVFISYRRADTQDVAATIADRLRQDLGGSNVFRDEEDLIAGRPWSEALDDELDGSDVAMFLVGPGWTGDRPDGTRRIDDTQDPVGAEVRQALGSESSADPFPVLIDLESPPTPLPAGVAPLFERHAVRTTRRRLLDGPADDYQGILVGIWDAMRRKTPRGVLVIGDQGAMASLDGVVEEMKDAKLIDARKLSRFASGAAIVSGRRRLRRRANQWPDAIVVVDDGEPSDVLRARIRAVNAHPAIKNVTLVGAGLMAGFALGGVLGGAAGAGTTFTASTQLAASIPQAATGPLAAVSTAWAGAATGVKVAVVAGAVAVAGVGVTTQVIGGGEPIQVTYGYVDLKVAEVRSTSDAPDSIAQDEPATYVAFDLTVTNPVRDFGFTLPPGVFVAEADGEAAVGVTENGEDIGVPPESAASTTLWFAFPDGAAVGDPDLVVRETGAEPLVISLTDPVEISERVPVTMSGDYRTECNLIEFGPGFASYNAGVTELGDRRPAPGVSAVGRAAENEILVSFDITATESCTGAASFFYIRFVNFTAILESRVGDWLVNTANSEFDQVNSETIDGQLTASVPETAAEPLEIDFNGPGDDIITLQADLSGIGVLISE